MQNEANRKIVEKKEARQAERIKGMWIVLGVGTLLAIILVAMT